MNSIIQLIAVCAIPLIFSITMHEAAHGYAARKFGDNTAWMMGRVTLNPAKHIDPFGTIILPLIMLAGPGCNLLQAVIWGIILKLLVIAGVQEQFFLQMAVYGISINIFLMAFNLIPIPPLDGGRVAVGILPWSVGKYLDRIEPYGMWIVLALCLVGGAGFFTGPLVAFGRAVVNFFIGL